MILPNRVLSVLLSCALAAFASAQRTVIVDANGGPGVDYTDLPGALAAVQDGDLILVRPGEYTGYSMATAASFSIVADGGAVVRTPPGPPPPSVLRISLDGASDQRVGIRGLTVFSSSTAQSALNVRSPRYLWPAPTVHLEDCTIESLSPNPSRVGLVVVALSAIVERCTLGTSQLQDSVVTVLDSQITGADAQSNVFVDAAETALDVLNSEVWIGSCALWCGQSLYLNRPGPSCLGFSDVSTKPASVVWIFGASSLYGDQSPSPNYTLRPLIRNYRSAGATATVHVESSVVMTPGPGGLVGSLVLLDGRLIPNLHATGAPIGGTFTSTVRGNPGASAAVLIGFTAFPSRVFGSAIFLDLTNALTLGSGTLDAAGSAAFALGIPNDQSLRGLLLETTGVTIDGAAGLSITNPAGAIVH